MTPAVPEPVFLEVVDSGATHGGQGLMPDQVLLNGVPLAVKEGSPIIVHEIVAKPGELVTVTLTLVASAVSIRPGKPAPRRRGSSLPLPV